MAFLERLKNIEVVGTFERINLVRYNVLIAKENNKFGNFRQDSYKNLNITMNPYTVLNHGLTEE